MSRPLVEVVRSGFREGVHHGSVVLLGPDGAPAHAVGEVVAPIFPRSSNKPLQALAMVRAGLDVDDAALALVCASHNGEPEHVAGAFAILRGAGLGEDDLRCPADLPLHEPSARAALAAGEQPRRVFMNCSGKHAGMLATCVVNGWTTHDYLSPGHPLQRAVADTLAELAGEPVAATAVDGCGAPLYAVGLTGLARA
ncbi:MAG TPA: asparaginase, partial [Pseudonocardiaceae bacterium]